MSCKELVLFPEHNIQGVLNVMSTLNASVLLQLALKQPAIHKHVYNSIYIAKFTAAGLY